MTRTELYRAQLSAMTDWEPYLWEHSGLPGPRANLELAQVVADIGDEVLFMRLLGHDASRAPVNSPQEFLAFCGVVGLGRLAAEGRLDLLPLIRTHASDPRWRMREGVAMALQRLGTRDMGTLLREMKQWARGNLLERRAAAAGLCEPALLREPADVAKVLAILDLITASVLKEKERKSAELVALKKRLGYCWSVAVVALPDQGKPRMERWFASDDPDVRWIMRENLKKARLARMDARWVKAWSTRLAA